MIQQTAHIIGRDRWPTIIGGIFPCAAATGPAYGASGRRRWAKGTTMTIQLSLAAFSNLHEDEDTGDLLIIFHGPQQRSHLVRVARSIAGLLSAAIASQLETSTRPLPDCGRTQIPVVRQSRLVANAQGDPCLEMRVDHKFPLVVGIHPSAISEMRALLTRIEELQSQSSRPRPAH